ncbi:MAG: YqjF family protein [Luteolibacter sp.]
MHQRLAMREKPPGFPVMRQCWSGLLFLHWRVPVETIAARLPAGLHVDTFDGSAWLGLVPFFMERVRPVLLPPVPGISWFMELNVRTYVHDDAGNPGVWFFSLDCNQPLAVKIARRAFHLPYQHAAMKAERSEERIYYTCRRESQETDAVFDYEAAGDDSRPAAEGSLEWFLVERYLLFSADRAARLYRGRVHHEPYRIAPAKCRVCAAEPLRWDGFAVPEQTPDSMLAAKTVDVRVFPLAAARGHADGLPR